MSLPIISLPIPLLHADTVLRSAPTAVLVISLLFIAAVILLHIIGKFRR